MSATDLANITSRLTGSPYLTQEVIYGAGEPITPEQYVGIGESGVQSYTEYVTDAAYRERARVWTRSHTVSYQLLISEQIPLYDAAQGRVLELGHVRWELGTWIWPGFWIEFGIRPWWTGSQRVPGTVSSGLALAA